MAIGSSRFGPARREPSGRPDLHRPFAVDDLAHAVAIDAATEELGPGGPLERHGDGAASVSAAKSRRASSASYLAAGIDHLSFYLRLEHEGRDLYPELMRIAAEGREPHDNRVRYEVLRHLG